MEVGRLGTIACDVALARAYGANVAVVYSQLAYREKRNTARVSVAELTRFDVPWLSRDTVTKAIAALKRVGLVTVTSGDRRDRRNTYQTHPNAFPDMGSAGQTFGDRAIAIAFRGVGAAFVVSALLNAGAHKGAVRLSLSDVANAAFCSARTASRTLAALVDDGIVRGGQGLYDLAKNRLGDLAKNRQSPRASRSPDQGSTQKVLKSFVEIFSDFGFPLSERVAKRLLQRLGSKSGLIYTKKRLESESWRWKAKGFKAWAIVSFLVKDAAQDAVPSPKDDASRAARHAHNETKPETTKRPPVKRGPKTNALEPWLDAPGASRRVAWV